MDRADRRTFLARAAALASAGASLAGASRAGAMGPGRADGDAAPVPAGTSAAGKITAATIAEAERLAGITFTDAERAQLLRTIEGLREQLAARVRAGTPPNHLAPAEAFRAELPGSQVVPVTASGDPSELPLLKVPAAAPDGEELCWEGIPRLAAMLRAGVITSERLVRACLDRIDRLNPRLLCAITVTREHAIARAQAMDAELREGKWRGPLHGVPYAAKDILDTAGIRTTWGAEPWKDRVPGQDAWVVRALDRAGAVLVAKSAVGALAYGDIWFGGTCRNPWNPEQGSSGSSAGSASGVAAGLFPFAIGTETLGSIVSPCVRCGASGLRPTFGRVPRTGCMSLVWSMDKVGAIARSAAGCGVVLGAINGHDPMDPCSVDRPFRWSMSQDARGLRVGIAPGWFDGPDPGARAGIEAALRDAGARIIEVRPPDADPTPLLVPLLAESAAAFEDLTRSGSDDALAWQADEAWPNTFRQAWFIPAIELVQASRLRRAAMESMDRFFAQADAFVAPPFAGNMLLLTNSCGQPCAVARAGFGADGQPRSATAMSRLFDEGTALRVASALEDRLAADARRPNP